MHEFAEQVILDLNLIGVPILLGLVVGLWLWRRS